MTGPVFIIGGSRTGSELLKNFFRKYTEIDMIPEMFLLCPSWLHEDFSSSANKYIGGLGENCDVEALLEFMYSKKPYGQFWQVIEELDRDELRKKLEHYGCSLKGVFSAILDVHAQAKGKKITGAKFPLHFGYVDHLLEWFPDCKLIHTVRDPRAIYSSQSNKYARKDGSVLRNTWIRSQQLLHILIQSEWTARVHEKLQHNKNYHLSRYEDLILDPASSLQAMCGFLEIPYEESMENPELYNSNTSFGKAGASGAGFDKSSLKAWKKRIHPITAGLITRLNARAMRNFGYAEKQKQA